MRGIETELDCGLIGGSPEFGEEVANLLLAGVDDLASRGAVDGGGHALTKLLEAASQLIQEHIGGKGGLGGHWHLLFDGETGVVPGLLSRAFFST